MTILGRLRSGLKRQTPEQVFQRRVEPPKIARPAASDKRGVKVSDLYLAAHKPRAAVPQPVAYKLPAHMPGVLPEGRTAQMAMDDAGGLSGVQFGASLNYINQYHGQFAEGVIFMGYPYLAELSQRVEYRRPSEVMAEEMTRKWIKLTATGKQNKSDKLGKLDDALKRFRLQEVVRDAIELDGFYGLSHIFIDVGDSDQDDKMLIPLIRKREMIGKGDLKQFKLIDPTWTAPNKYNTNDPLHENYYRPEEWFVLGRRVHRSRFLTIISRPVPDLIKPAYNFGGISLSQMLKPYVDNWLRTRQSVSDLIAAFSTFVLSTNMEAMIQDTTSDGLGNRVALFNASRTNLGTMVVDKDTETFENVSASLGTLDKLQAQAQEQQASAAAIPLVKLLGVTPSGLNASSDGEIRTFYDTCHARQERVLRDLLKIAIEVIQLNEFGEIDPEIDFGFNPLWQLDEAGKAAVRKVNVDTAAILLQEGVIDPSEERIRISQEDDSPYAGLEGPPPEPPPMPEGTENLSDPSEGIAASSAKGKESGALSGDAAFDAWA